MSRVVIRPVGQAGEGVPTGGTTGQILAKASNTNFDTEWTDNDPDGVQSVTGDGVGGTASDVVLTFPTPAEIGAVATDTSGSSDVLAIWGGTQAEYDAIGSPTATTLYVVTA
jgi:hypothetical protein